MKKISIKDFSGNRTFKVRHCTSKSIYILKEANDWQIDVYFASNGEMKVTQYPKTSAVKFIQNGEWILINQRFISHVRALNGVLDV